MSFNELYYAAEGLAYTKGVHLMDRDSARNHYLAWREVNQIGTDPGHYVSWIVSMSRPRYK